MKISSIVCLILLSAAGCHGQVADVPAFSLADPSALRRANLDGKKILLEIEPSDLGKIQEHDEKTISVDLLGWYLLFPKGSEEKLSSMMASPKGYIVLTLDFPPKEKGKRIYVKVEKVGPLTSVRQIVREAAQKQVQDDPLKRPENSTPITWQEYQEKLKAGAADYKVFALRFRASDLKVEGESTIEKRANGEGISLLFEGGDSGQLVLEVTDGRGANWVQEMVKRKAAQIEVYVRLLPAEEFPRIIGNWFQPKGDQGVTYSFR